MKTFTVTAKDAAGNETIKTVSYRVLDAVNTPGTIGGSVPATLSLTLAGPANFGAFTPGVAKEYTAVDRGDGHQHGRRRDAERLDRPAA